MKVTLAHFTQGVVGTAVGLMLLSGGTPTVAQQVSFGYERFPHVGLVDPITGSEDFAIQASSMRFGAAFPLMFANSAVRVRNDITYKRTDFGYRNLPVGGPGLERLHAVELSMFMIDSVSERWKMVVAVLPGIASDLEAPLSSHDFTFGAVFGFVRQMSRTSQLGTGVVYMSNFGEPIPVPFLYVDWQVTPRLSTNGILPTNMAVAYRVNRNLDLGLALQIDGTRYHGNPAKYDAANPLLKYSEGTVSPSVRVHLSPWLHVNVEGGYAFYRRFEFFDGGHKAFSFDLRHKEYFRTGLVIGM